MSFILICMKHYQIFNDVNGTPLLFQLSIRNVLNLHTLVSKSSSFCLIEKCIEMYFVELGIGRNLAK